MKWYSFKNNIVVDGIIFDVLTTVREKAKGNYGYSIKFHEKNRKNGQPGVQIIKSPADKTLKALPIDTNISLPKQKINGNIYPHYTLNLSKEFFQLFAVR